MSFKYKICLLGAAGVGKTSLTKRFVRGLFSDEYQTTVGVTIERKRVQRAGGDVDLLIWDLSGEDEFQRVQLSYLEGASGYLLVVDGTRASTLSTARTLQAAVDGAVGLIPFVLLVNKADIADAREVNLSVVDPLATRAVRVIRTSARTGAGVEAGFSALIDAFLPVQIGGARR